MYKPNAGATDVSEVRRLINPPKISKVKDVIVSLQHWENKLLEVYDRTGEEVINETTKRQLMVNIMPDVIKKRLLELRELNPKSSISTLRSALLNRGRHIFGTEEADKSHPGLNALRELPADGP